MLKGCDIICISSIDWDFIWQGHQQIMSSLADSGNRVLFIENTGVRAPTLRDLPRLRKRIRNWIRGTKGFREEKKGLFVYSPVLLPFPYSRIAQWINRSFLLRAIHRWMRAMEFHRPIVWTFLPTPLACQIIRALQGRLTIYYCIDDLASSSSAAHRIRRTEDHLFRTADCVFVTSAKLQKRALQFRSQAFLFPFGVDYERFEQVRLSPDEIPAELKTLPQPIVGYVGGIHKWLDQDLLVATAKQFPQGTFVLVGPAQTDIAKLSQCKNIRLLGPKRHEEIPRYVKGFDVGIVPYRLNPYTDHVYPTKLNEYLAMGIPVIATDLPEIRRFNSQHGPIVQIASGHQEFVPALEQALAGRNKALSLQRIAVAQQNGWQARITQMSDLIEEQIKQHESSENSWRELLLQLYRKARHRMFAITVSLTMGYLALFHSPLLWVIAEPLRVSSAPQHADAIVVFAGGVGESGKAGGGYQERVKQAVDLYQDDLAAQLIFVSGYTFVLQEADLMRSLAIDFGVPPSAILVEKTAASTAEYVRAVKRVIEQHKWQRVLLVSSPYHMRRATWTWQKLAPNVHVIPIAVVQSQFYTHTTGSSLEQIRGIFHEYASIVYYWFKGWI